MNLPITNLLLLVLVVLSNLRWRLNIKNFFFFFLTILNDSYGNLTSQILLAEPLPSINKVRSLILQEEKRSIGHEVNVVYPVEATAMYANTRYNAKAHQG